MNSLAGSASTKAANMPSAAGSHSALWMNRQATGPAVPTISTTSNSARLPRASVIATRSPASMRNAYPTRSPITKGMAYSTSVSAAAESSPERVRDRRVADAALLMVTLLWATSFPLIKGSMSDVSPILLTGLRFAITCALMWPMLLKVRANRRAWADGAILGVLLFGCFATQVTGMIYTSASNSAFVTATTTPMVPIADYLMRRRRPSLATIAGIVIALGGVWLLSGGTVSRGDWWTLACAAIYAVYMVKLDDYLARSPYQVVLYGQMATAAVLAFAASPLIETPKLVVTALSIRTIVLLSLGATAGALYLQNRYQSRTTPTRAALIFLAEPVFAAGFSYLLLHEVLPLRGYFGAGLIIGGILLSELL